MVRVPDTRDQHIRQVLSDRWERTKDVEVSQFRYGECRVRILWDNAFVEAMDWDPDELTRLRLLLHDELHACGLGYTSTETRWRNGPRWRSARTKYLETNTARKRRAIGGNQERGSTGLHRRQ